MVILRCERDCSGRMTPQPAKVQGARGIPTPANETLVEVTRRITAGELKPDPSNLSLAIELLKSKTHRAG